MLGGGVWFSVSLIKHHDRATHVAVELLAEGERRERTMPEFKMNHVVTKSVAGSSCRKKFSI